MDASQTIGRERLGVIAHELIYLLESTHVDPVRFAATLMVAGGSDDLSAHLLHRLDREALYAVYGRLKPEPYRIVLPRNSDPGSDTSTLVSGAIENTVGEIAFGTALKTRLSQPWAVGPAPNSNLEDNMGLSGSVRWSGRLSGLTPRAETVAGTTDLTSNWPRCPASWTSPNSSIGLPMRRRERRVAGPHGAKGT